MPKLVIGNKEIAGVLGDNMKEQSSETKQDGKNTQLCCNHQNFRGAARWSKPLCIHNDCGSGKSPGVELFLPFSFFERYKNRPHHQTFHSNRQKELSEHYKHTHMNSTMKNLANALHCWLGSS